MPYTPEQLENLFNAIRMDWQEAYSTLLEENFIVNLN
jgi:hypothetical protein